MNQDANLLVIYTIKGNKTQEFLAEVNKIDLIRKTRMEAGNKEYRYMIPTDNSSQVVLWESWLNQQYLNKHRNTEHFKALEKIKEKYVINTLIRQFNSI